jgi:hypothetical protein
VLVTLVSAKGSVIVRDLATGVARSTVRVALSCDWRGSLAVTADGAAAYALCLDATFGKNTVYGVDLTGGAPNPVTFSTVVKALDTYWPPALVAWGAAGLAVGLSDRAIVGLAPGNGSVVFRAVPPPAVVTHVLAAAAVSAPAAAAAAAADADAVTGGGGPAATPILYVLAQSDGPGTPAYLLAYNATGGAVAPPVQLWARVDQFQGTIIADPSGLTVTVNGWDPRAPAQPPMLVRVTLDPAAGTWAQAAAPSFPTAGTGDGRLALFAAPRTNGSVVVVGWQGVYQWN